MRFPALAVLPALALVIGCNGGGDDTGLDDTGLCENSVVDVSPEGDDVFYMSDIVVELDDAEADATIVLTDADGNDVAGTVTVDDDEITFDPTDALAPNTEYTITVDYSCGMPEYTFTTSDVGTPVSDAAGLEGNAYSIDLKSGTIVRPAGVGAVIGDMLDTEVLVAVEAYDDGASTLEMMGALGDGAGAQDVCTPTIAFPEAVDFSANPYFEVSSESTLISVAGYSATIYELEISGAFAADGGSIEGVGLKGVLDAREIVDLVDELDNADDACTMVEQLVGTGCEACPTDNEEYCLGVEIANLQGTLVADLELVEITEPDAEVCGEE